MLDVHHKLLTRGIVFKYDGRVVLLLNMHSTSSVRSSCSRRGASATMPGAITTSLPSRCPLPTSARRPHAF